MVKYVAVFLFFLGVLLFSAGQWLAFEVYANIKLLKINQNITSLLARMQAEEGFINIPNSEENYFLIRTGEGKVISTGRIPSTGMGNYIFTSSDTGSYQVQVYTKRVGLSEYLRLLFERPFALGVSVSGLVLFFLSMLLLLKKETVPTEQKMELQEDILKKLKAVRTALAFGNVIPRESLKEAKGIIEDIIKSIRQVRN